MPQTVLDLGLAIKAKYPEYKDMNAIALGRLVKQKYPGAYDDYADMTPAKGVGGAGNYTQDMGMLGVSGNQILNQLEGAGIDAAHPITGTLKNFGSALLGQNGPQTAAPANAMDIVSRAPMAGLAYGNNPTTQAVTNTAHAALSPITSASQAIGGMASGDWESAARGAGGFAASLPIANMEGQLLNAGARGALGAITTPENLMLRAANNRQLAATGGPFKGGFVDDLVASGAGGAIGSAFGHPALGTAAGELANIVRQVPAVRLGKAAMLEGAAKWLSGPSGAETGAAIFPKPPPEPVMSPDNPAIVAADEARRAASWSAMPPATADAEFQPINKNMVDGLRVRDQIPNIGSIESSLSDYTIRRGVREIPLTAFENQSLTRSPRVTELASQIKASGEISPLIVVMDDKGPYILEGSHRFEAMKLLGKKSLPALVVDDVEAQQPLLNVPRPGVQLADQQMLASGADAQIPDWRGAMREPAGPASPVSGEGIGRMYDPNAPDWTGQLRSPASPQSPVSGEGIQDLPQSEIPPATPENLMRIERGIKPRGGLNAQRSTMKNAPKLLEQAPELATTPPGELFDQRLFSRFKQSESAVDAVENAIPDTTAVAKAPIVSEWNKLRQDFEARGLMTAAKAIQTKLDAWDELPDQIPWKTFIERKRAFLKDSRTVSPWLKPAFGPLMKASSDVSPELSTANGVYSIFRTAMDDAKMDLSTGRRIGEVGKPPKPPLKGAK